MISKVLMSVLNVVFMTSSVFDEKDNLKSWQEMKVSNPLHDEWLKTGYLT